MKLIYSLISISLLLYGIVIFSNYFEKTTDIKQIDSYNTVLPLKKYLDFNASAYIFKEAAWGLKPKKIVIEKEDKNSTKTQPFILDKQNYPIKLCSNKRCFEFMAIKNNSVLFYGPDKNNTVRFLKLDINQTLENRLQLKSINTQEIKIVDLLFNKEIDIKMFDVNVSQYRVDTIKEKNEKIKK